MDKSVRILAVDDDAPTRRLLIAAFSSDSSYEIVAARSAHEALTAFQANPAFDLLITDLMMPIMGGIELTQRIRALGADLPILVLTSMLTDQSIAAALEAGADDYLQKPVDLRKLRTAASDLMARYQERKASGKAAAALKPNAKTETREPSAVRNVEEGTFVELTSRTSELQAERFQRFAERVLIASLTDKERNELRLALEEIVRNAIEWGNQNDPNKALRLSYCLLNDRITFRVEDEGTGFNPAVLKDPSLDPASHIRERRASGKRMGGWGIFLARKMVDEVTFNRKGNVVFLTKYLHRGDTEADAAGTKSCDDTSPANPPISSSRRTTRLLHKTSNLLR